MTNWVSNRWDATGTDEDLDAFERLLLPERSPPRPVGLLDRLRGGAAPPAAPPAPDFERVMPSPAALAGDHSALADWRLARWGTSRPALPGSHERSPGRVRLAFATPWSHPEGIVVALAPLLPPALVVEGAYVEMGNEVAGRFRIAAGRCEDREVPYSDAFFEEVTGGPADDGG